MWQAWKTARMLRGSMRRLPWLRRNQEELNAEIGVLQRNQKKKFSGFVPSSEVATRKFLS